ncbi:helix-turn-helix domain-containing protein [Microbacterium sp. JC 701]|uniref:helix-turn-helix domain-containing protein n=1 Tax=Microbacterium sp. JC 701 TaxID=2897389 RepID=UPI001E2A817A|nr:helix-turn-helix domain-containing protein [Microbacterium sp. JC 701]MCD2170360.1 helix-turn-helix domain-containing protein [Microbacterium sp. JC 701]
MIHLDGDTFRAIEAAAHRASKVAGREVQMRELIENRLADAVVGIRVPTPPRRVRMNNGRAGQASRLSDEGREAIRSLTEQGRSAKSIAEEVGCHRQTVLNYRRKLRDAQQHKETRTA